MTPWTATDDALGHQIPNVGWYAFDVDLSVYRKGNTMQADNFIKPTLHGYSEENVNLYGKLNADITGNIDMKKCCVNNMSGAFGPFEDLLGQVKDVKSFFDNARSLYSDVTSGNILGAIEGGIGLAKQGCDLAGIDYGGGSEGFDGYKGEVNLKMQGTIDFLGKISKNTAIEGTSSIEQHLSKYNFEGNHMGEGIWNISDAPVVYYTDAYVDWKVDDYMCGTYLDVKSPFGGRVFGDNTDEEYFNEKPHQGRICYFDPTSIKLELNPNIFTADEIKNAKVFATCGVRKGVKFGSTDAFRAAQGLTASTVKQDLTSIYWNRLTDGAPYDAMKGFTAADQMGMKAGTKFETEKVDGKWYGMIGRGNDNYLLEPLGMHGDKNEDLLPPYEVTVTVMVEHDGKQMVYSRNYLPEYKLMKVENMPDYNPSKFLRQLPDNYMPSVFLQQAVRLHELKKWLYRTLQPTNGTYLVYYDWFPFYIPQKEGHGALFDGNNTTPWRLYKDNMTDQYGNEKDYNSGVYDSKRLTWWTEFQTNYPVKPSSYTMVTGRHGSEAPTEWALMGKTREGDKWILLDYRKGNDLPNKPTTSKEFNFNRLTPSDVGGVGYKYFRLEIYSVRDNNEMSLCEFWFNYKN